MDINIIRQIQKINSNNTTYLFQERKHLASIYKMISSNTWNDYDVERILIAAAVIDKKASDSTISLNKIYKDRVYDNYELSMSSYFNNAVYVSDTLPEMAPALSAISFSIQYTNVGMFNSWNDIKGIKARVDVYRTSGIPQRYDPLIKLLDTTIPQNIPGDIGPTETNADYGKTKIFNFVSDSDYAAGDYLFTFTIIDKTMIETSYDTYFINSQYVKQIQIV